jgi:hypothetical protein
MITNSGKVLDPAAPDKYHGMFLQIMPNPGNISSHLGPVGKPHTGNLAKRRIGLLGSLGHHTGTNPPLLGTGLKGRRLRFEGNLPPSETNQLINCRHQHSYKNAATSGVNLPRPYRKFLKTGNQTIPERKKRVKREFEKLSA